MRLSDLKVHYKIAAPFGVLFLASTLVLAFVAFMMISRTLEQRVSKQVESASEMISQSDFALNKAVLERLKLIVNADIVTYTGSGETIASTFGQDRAAFVRVIEDPEIGDRIVAKGSKLETRDLNFEGIPYRIAYRPVSARPDAVVAFVADVSDKAAAQATIGRTIVVITIVILVIMFIASEVLAQSISRPLLELVSVTKAVASGDLTKKAKVQSHDEIGILAGSLNDMVDDLRKSKEKLIESEKLAVAGMMAARVAHDIRNPLSSIKMQVQMLQPRLVPGQGKQEIVRAILTQIDRVELVVKGLLDLARPAEMNPVLTNLHHFLEEILQQVDAQMRHRKIDVATDFDSSVPDLLLDFDRLTHAILNVLFNAADAMPTGGAIRVTTRLQSDRTVLLAISDEGTGIDPLLRDRIFDPFVSTKREGVGLGLVNVRSVVEKHGGTIRLEPRPTGGTVAIIQLPLPGDGVQSNG